MPSSSIHFGTILKFFLFALYFNAKKIQTNYNKKTDIIAINQECEDIFQ